MKELTDSKARILYHLSRCALSPSCGDVIFLDEKKQFHVESFYLVNEPPIREIVTDIAIKEIEIDKIQNLAGFMLGGYSLASLIAYSLKLPFYAFDLESYDPDFREVNIRLDKAGNNFALIVGYTSTKEQINDAILKVERQGGKVVKVISMIDEEMGAKGATEAKGIGFASILTLSEVKNEIKTRKKQVKERISSVDKLLK